MIWYSQVSTTGNNSEPFVGHLLQDSYGVKFSKDFNATSFAFGYASHLLLDTPAFATPTSYLALDLPNWMNTWYHMNIIDAVVLGTHKAPDMNDPPKL